jgi:peroxiredoxin
MRPFVAALVAGSLAVACATSSTPPTSSPVTQSARAPREGDELLLTRPPEWHVDHWMNSRPLTLAELRGHVVLVRWFMSERCPMCSATAPALRALDHDYRDRGLVVVGMYHHKDPEPLDPARVEKVVRGFGFEFPVAIDTDWRTLKAWWLDGHEREYTSVSFLLDKTGAIRFIHPGGKYEPGSADEREVRGHVEALLRE